MMSGILSSILTGCLFLIPLCTFPQGEIPLGEWRLHPSYSNIQSIARSSDAVFAAAPNSVIRYDTEDASLTSYTRLNGLSGTSIEHIAYASDHDKLIVAYANGTFDVISQNAVRSFDPSRNTVLTGEKTIHDIVVHAGLAYLPTDYGVLVFDLARTEIKETWRDLGPGGTTLAIRGVAFLNDSIFLASDNGVLAGDRDDNLLDFNKWKRMSAGELNDRVDFLATFNNVLYAAVSGTGIFAYESGVWTKEAMLTNSIFSALAASAENLLIAEDNNLWTMSKEKVFTQLTDDLITNANDVVQDASGKLWIADTSNGLVTNNSGAFQSIKPNGPASDRMTGLQFHDNRMYAVAGGFAANLPLQNPGLVSFMEDGTWQVFDVPASDLTDIAFSPDGSMYIASFGHGVVAHSADVIFDETNSTLVNSNPPGRNVKITSLHFAPDGLWVANYGAVRSLHRLGTDNQWESFTIPFTAAQFPLKLLSDFEGNIWMQLNPAGSGGLVVYRPSDGESRYLTEADENGELPSNAVHSMAIDRDGYVWAGTDAGVAYFYDDGSDAVKPIFESRFLLRDEKVTAIAVDGGNRKWMGSENGVWLFDPTGENLIRNFTTANSPIPSNSIVDIEINPATGEVFFATDQGLISYRSDATESRAIFGSVKIFPNPVLNNFMGEVGISGLATDATVKITDVSGKLIYQTVANGGTASWDVRDHRGRRVPTGVFLVFAVNVDGSESIVGKIAVVN